MVFCSEEVQVHTRIPNVDNQDSVRRLAIFRLNPVYEFIIFVNMYTPVCDACYVYQQRLTVPEKIMYGQ